LKDKEFWFSSKVRAVRVDKTFNNPFSAQLLAVAADDSIPVAV
jgi:hypothetical protein